MNEYVYERDARRGDPEEPGSSRALRASAGQRATNDLWAQKAALYLPRDPVTGCVRPGGGLPEAAEALRCHALGQAPVPARRPPLATAAVSGRHAAAQLAPCPPARLHSCHPA